LIGNEIGTSPAAIGIEIKPGGTLLTLAENDTVQGTATGGDGVGSDGGDGLGISNSGTLKTEDGNDFADATFSYSTLTNG
jgi:hypothetical protein